MAEKMQGKGSVTSCDIYEHKLKRIRDGAARLGLPNIRTELQDASVCREEWKDSADVVLCDVPCSGLGIIRKKPEIRFKNPDEIRTLPEIQARILANCAQYVKKAARSSTRPVPSCSGRTRTLSARFSPKTRSLKRFRGRIRSAERGQTVW